MMKTVATLSVCLLGFLAGCSTEPTRDPDFAAVRPRPAPVPQATGGAIYQAGYEIVLFEDQRARRVGDILTVMLVEKTDAEKSADTNLEKSNTTTVENPTLLGQSVSFDVSSAPFGKGLPLSSTSNNNLNTTLSSDHDFEGKGDSSQSNSLTGDITVTVAEVLPNGNLVVQGEKLITLNQGNEHIRFSGTVRPADIDANNTVLSTKVANARIVYAGEGPLPDANKIGWLARFFISLIFPF